MTFFENQLFSMIAAFVDFFLRAKFAGATQFRISEAVLQDDVSIACAVKIDEIFVNTWSLDPVEFPFQSRVLWLMHDGNGLTRPQLVSKSRKLCSTSLVPDVRLKAAVLRCFLHNYCVHSIALFFSISPQTQHLT